jgi:hypothetical protein
MSISGECQTTQEIEGLAARLKTLERAMPSVNREAVRIDEDSLVEAALRRARVSRRGRGWSTKQESCFYPNEDVSLREATSLGKSISPSPSKMCRLVKASSWCAGLDDMETELETEPAHGIRSLDDALKEFERLAAFRPVWRGRKQGNTKQESSMSNEDVLSNATSFGASISPSPCCKILPSRTPQDKLTGLEPEFPAHGVRSLDDALKDFERLAAFRPVWRRGKQGNTKQESSASNESDAPSFGASISLSSYCKILPSRTTQAKECGVELESGWDAIG